MKEAGQPDRQERGHVLGDPTALNHARPAFSQMAGLTVRAEGATWVAHHHVTSPGSQDTETPRAISPPAALFSRENKRVLLPAGGEDWLAWLSILDLGSWIHKQEKAGILTWGWGGAGNGSDSHPCWNWADISSRVKANSGRAAGSSRPISPTPPPTPVQVSTGS